MYRAVKNAGDALPVPQLVFSKLAAAGTSDARFRVALYMLSCDGAEAEQVAAALQIKRADVEAELNYWEGAGLLERDAPAVAAQPVAKRRTMTTREVVAAGRADPALGWMLEELQRLFGTVMSESDVNVYVTLHMQDGFAPDMVLLAASVAMANGAKRAKYVEKVLLNWRAEGIDDPAAVDRYLRLMAEREEREKALAERMGLAWDPFRVTDKRTIARWFEEYGYDFAMVDEARLAAGSKQNEVKYLNGILKKWFGKGYRTPREVQQGEQGRNVQEFHQSRPSDEDLLQGETQYVPMKQRSSR